jgi:hypothetical protein
MSGPILVTGGRGFLGRHVVEALAGAELVAPTRADYDLTEQAAVRALISDVRPRVVVHLAAACGGIFRRPVTTGAIFIDEIAQMHERVIRAAGLDGSGTPVGGKLLSRRDIRTGKHRQTHGIGTHGQRFMERTLTKRRPPRKPVAGHHRI